MSSGVNAATVVAPEARGVQSRPRAQLRGARSLGELRDQVAALLSGLYRPGSRCELFASRAGDLQPVARPDGTDASSRALLASVRVRLLTASRSLSEPQALSAHETSGRRPVITAPVFGPADDLLGLVIVEGAPHHPDFSNMDLVALEGIAALVSLALQRVEPAALDAAHARRDLDRAAARRIQRGFMSATLPPGAGVTAQAEYLPAFDVGGDFYSVRLLADRSVSATIGDVSGNGVAAALLMARVTATVERLVDSGASPAEVLSGAHAALGPDAGDMFATAACVRIDADRRRLTVASAGHLPLVLRRESGEVFTFGGASGTPLGMLSGEYGEDELLLEKGDIVLLLTDGLLEALDHPSGHRGIELLVSEIHAAGHDPLAINRRLRAIVARAALEHALDDVTWVGLRIAP